jgi:hypothetical protein
MTVTISVKTDFAKLAATLNDLGRNQLPFAASRALNDAAKATAARIDADMTTIFRKATPFTRNAVVAPPSLGARKDRLAAMITLRPLQGEYLLHEQIGGTRTPAENTRRPNAKALVLPGPQLKLNSYGNIPDATLAKLTAQLTANANQATTKRHFEKAQSGKRVRAVASRDRGVFYAPPTGSRLEGGFWLRLPGQKMTHLIAFKATTSYHAKFDYTGRVIRSARVTFAASIGPRLAEAIASAKP